MYLGIATAALATLVVVLLIARRGDDRKRPDNAALLAGSDGDPAGAAQRAPDPSGDSAAGPGGDDPQPAGTAGSAEPGAGSAAPAGGGAGSQQDPGPTIELPPDRIGPKPPKPPKPPVEKADPATLYRSGINAYVVGDMRTALTHFKRAIAVNPSFAMAWRGVGMVHERLGDARSATTAFQRYLQLAPNASDAAAIRGKIGGSR
jgi:tetratricopeptide (TPR) repeat protein